MSAGLDHSLYGSAPVEIFEFRQGANAWRYTSSDAPVTHLGHSYEPGAIARKGISHTREASSGSVELTLPRTDPVVRLFIGHLPPTSVKLT
ncbi:MAG: hypothetical protein Q8R97_12600, partial [Brevundimonas sp.]|nr:hypothetical protein [Brevundimonas sp.]